MKIERIIIENGHIDSNGDQVDLKGLSFGKLLNSEIPISENFNSQESPPIGFAYVYIEEDVMKADLNLIKEINLNYYPAIGGQVIERDKDNPKLITRFQLREVSLCSNKNADDTIKTIGEQIGGKNG